ncbi:MAG TPA: hypothetical protein VEA41_21910 [Salinarimonas sp.]|nr:hypothetical protein [Salinarimonas sp.]
MGFGVNKEEDIVARTQRVVGGDFGYVIDAETSSHWMDFRVFSIVGRSSMAPDSTPSFVRAEDNPHGNKMTDDLAKAQPMCSGFIKWDGCFQVTEFDDMPLHWDSLINVKAFSDLFPAIWALADEIMPNFQG